MVSKAFYWNASFSRQCQTKHRWSKSEPDWFFWIGCYWLPFYNPDLVLSGFHLFRHTYLGKIKLYGGSRIWLNKIQFTFQRTPFVTGGDLQQNCHLCLALTSENVVILWFMLAQLQNSSKNEEKDVPTKSTSNHCTGLGMQTYFNFLDDPRKFQTFITQVCCLIVKLFYS